MNFNYLLLILWAISGILTIISGLTAKDLKVSLISYILVWICLMCELICNIK
jgi:hypothetical protein